VAGEIAPLGRAPHLGVISQLLEPFATGEWPLALRHLNARPPEQLHFARIHSTLRVTPAMEAKITRHVWTIEEILDLLE
jgi:hypothetical protein